MNESPINGLLGPPTGYVDLLDEALLERNKREQEMKRYPLRPSASGYCARALAYSLHEFYGKASYPQEERSPSLLRLLQFGHSVEYHVLRMFGDIDLFQVKYKQQALSFFKVSPEKIIEGSIDFVFYIPGHKVIGDVKSKGDKWSSYRDSKWEEEIDKLRRMKSVQTISQQAFWVSDLVEFLDELHDPFFADNFIQLNMYACNDFIKERGIDHAVIMRYNKNSSKMMEVRFKPDARVMDYVEQKFKSIVQAVEIDGDPEKVEREYSLGTMRCAFCRFNKECYPVDNAKKHFFGKLPAKQWPTDTDRMGDRGAELEQLYEKLCEAQIADNNVEKAKDKLVRLLDECDVDKVRFADGEIFEIKFYKSPKPHLELKRSKL